MTDSGQAFQFENRDKWQPAYLVIGFWTLIAILYTSQTAYSAFAREGPIDWSNLLSWSLTRWYIWAGFTPLIFYLSKRFPIEKPVFKKRALIHFGLGLVIAAGHMLLESGLVYLIWQQLGKTIPPLERLKSLLAYNFHVNLFVYWAIVGAAHAFSYHTRLQEREIQASKLQTDLSRAQLKALKAQLQPHFLFNAHHTILGLMLKNERQKAITLLTRLSDLLRLTLESEHLQFSTIAEEINFIEHYLDIQRIRFEDRLRIEINVQPETRDATIPNLILQPIVENAIKHGIAPMSKTGRLEIRIEKQNGLLKMAVRDNGLGFQKKNTATNSGTGLANTKARLQHIYANAFQFSYGPSSLGGTEVSIEIPFQSKHDSEITGKPASK